MRLVVASLLALLPLAAQELPKPERVELPAPRGDHPLSGTAIAVDGAGIEHADEAGELILWQEKLGRIAVPITGGKWETRVASDEPLLVAGVALRDRQIDIERTEHELPLPDRLDLRGTWIDDLVVHVVDEKTGDELSGVDVVAVPRDWGGGDHPGDVTKEQLLRSNVASPLRFTRYGHWFVRAKGHVWSKLLFIDTEEMERTLGLSLECGLVVHLKGIDPAHPPSVRVEPVDGSAVIAKVAPRDDGRFEFQDLPPREVRVRAFLDFDGRPWVGHFVTLGQAAVSLAPGEAAHLELAVEPPPPGLHDDGTVDRTVVVTLPDGSRRVRASGDGEVVFRPLIRWDGDLAATPAAERSIVGMWHELVERASGVDGMASPRRVHIEDGTSSVRVPYGCWLDVAELRLDGEIVQLDRRQRRFDTTGEPFEIAVPGVADGSGTMAMRLHVVDAETKAELAGVRIVPAVLGGPHLFRRDVDHPGPIPKESLLVDRAASPFHPPKPRRDASIPWFWVGADGHAWARVKIDDEAKGEQFVELAPAAELEIEVEGEPPRGSVVRLRSGAQAERILVMTEHYLASLEASDADRVDQDDASLAEARASLLEQIAALRSGAWREQPTLLGSAFTERAADSGATIAVDGVPSGSYVVSCEIGEWSSEPQCFATASVEVVAGRRHTVRLDVPPQVVPAMVPLRGTLLVPVEWEIDSVDFSLLPERVPYLVDEDSIDIDGSDLRSVEGIPGLWRWDAGMRLPGTYQLVIAEFGHGQLVVLDREGALDVQVEIPPPADVVLHVVDDAGQPIAISDVYFQRDLSDAAEMRLHAQEPTSTFSFRAPQGPGVLSGWDDSVNYWGQDVVVVAGRNEFTVRLCRPQGVRLSFVGDVESIGGLDFWSAIETRNAAGERVRQGWEIDLPSIVLYMKEPGSFRVILPRLAGYQPFAPIEVDVRRGEFTEVEVELLPEKSP